VIQLTKQVALDYAKDRIHVNAVCPGMISTAMLRGFLDMKEVNEKLQAETPWPRLGTAEDVAKAVLILASDASSWMTGSMLQIDGGWIVK
jgi:NAD(P)-dependent dehydrogenase (short-subunit alcohol dehydrogenase family)